ncbi:MAG: co-chaperone GroES [Bacteroidales bacterium]|nr:co-chaperone GroES [Bacteroidales bacterium]
MSTDKLSNLIVVGDRVLIAPSDITDRTKGGLYLPAGYQEKEDVQTGYIVQCGPGYPLPSDTADESWQPDRAAPRYLPLQVQAGDFALFLRKNAIEVKYAGEKYYVVPQSAILLVKRDEF